MFRCLFGPASSSLRSERKAHEQTSDGGNCRPDSRSGEVLARSAIVVGIQSVDVAPIAGGCAIKFPFGSLPRAEVAAVEVSSGQGCRGSEQQHKDRKEHCATEAISRKRNPLNQS